MADSIPADPGTFQGANPIFPVKTWPSGAHRGISQVRYSHDAMVDAIIANPCITQNELGAMFNTSASWVSQVLTSDAFQARLHQRKDELTDPTIRATIKERFEAMVRRSLEILEQKLNKPADQVSDQLVLQTLGLTSRAAGYGARVEAPAPANVNVHVHLQEMAGNLTQLLRSEKAKAALPPIEVNPGE